MKSRISFYVATRQSHSDATIKQNPQEPKFMVSDRGIFAGKKSWGNRLREILCYQKSRGNCLGELIANLKF